MSAFVILSTSLGVVIFAYLTAKMVREQLLIRSQKFTSRELAARDLVYLASQLDPGAKVALKVIDKLREESPRSEAREKRIVELSSAWEWPD